MPDGPISGANVAKARYETLSFLFRKQNMRRVPKAILEVALLQRLKASAIGSQVAAIKVEARFGQIPNWKIRSVETIGDESKANRIAASIAESMQADFMLIDGD